ncbi:pentapeptide repeat-containing protein [Phormidium sp. LEGE 05292]|uniref:pentapeptide repeat-containing protein n=1 Tax=[Phormidium] sp. LEGE 05292 TaxID=767427 RepID=UPI0018817906|nr:pentapeptide repeat-containing protein [Phormidium sp. LEGE 05292]MBE9227715.1 pentapeptide repeat-containing protein [Phormidium sp. LEGE 05292]
MSQDFSHQNLQGRSFKGQNLTGANFSYADIRGANFSNAVLKGASFRYATAGLPNSQAVQTENNFIALNRLLLPMILLLPNMFLFFAFNSPKPYELFSPKFTNTYTILPGIFVLLLIALWFIAIILNGWEMFSPKLVVSVCLVQIGVMILGSNSIGTGIADLAYPAISCLYGVFWVTGSVLFSAVLARYIAGFRAGVLALVIFLVVTVAIAISVYFNSSTSFTAIINSAIVLAIGLLSTYVGWRALVLDEQFTKFGNFSLITTFGGADLTNADFTGAKLEHTNFRKAILTGTCWQEAKNLDRAIFDRPLN